MKELLKSIDCGEVTVDIFKLDNQLLIVGLPKDEGKKPKITYQIPIGRVREEGVGGILLEFKSELEKQE